MLDIPDRPILADMHVQPIRIVVHGDHIPLVHDAVFLGEFVAGERLSRLLALLFHRKRMFPGWKPRSGRGEETYHFVMLVAQLLAHQLRGPVVRLAAGGLQAWYDEGHVDLGCCFVEVRYCSAYDCCLSSV